MSSLAGRIETDATGNYASNPSDHLGDARFVVVWSSDSFAADILVGRGSDGPSAIADACAQVDQMKGSMAERIHSGGRLRLLPVQPRK